MNSSSEVLISVIVPVYNTEQYLQDCIQSIISQSFTNWELILVDDGSTDGSAAMCDEYTKKDSRVRVFHKANGGVSSARNLGLKHAKGKWVTFIDSDDWLESSYLSVLMQPTPEIEASDLIISYPKKYTATSEVLLPTERYEGVISVENIFLLFSECHLDRYTYLHSKFFQKAFIDKWNLRFDEKMPMGEDHAFLYSCLLKVHKIYVLKGANYNYRYVAGGASKRLYSLDTEFYGYNKIHALISSMIEKFNITDKAILSQIRKALAHYLCRVLQALYCHPVKRRIRIDILYALDFSDFNYNYCNLLKKYLLSIFFSHRGLFFYDCLKILQTKMKCL